MEAHKIISGETEQEIWPFVEADLAAKDVFTYETLIVQHGKRIQLYIDIDPGGGFEGGSEFTRLKAPLPVASYFRFAIHHQGFIDAIGKFFGMQDVTTGYLEFDEHVVVKTNNEGKISELFADDEVRGIFSKLTDFNLGIHTHHDEDSEVEHPWLEFYTDEAIEDTEKLRQIYHGFYLLLQQLDS